jgi:hypothetical protein
MEAEGDYVFVGYSSGARRLGYTVWVQGKMLKYPKDQAYDGVVAPYFAIGSDGPKGWFIFLLPVRLSAGESAVEVRSSEGGKVEDVRLRPAMEGVTVSAEFPGSVDGVYFPQDKPHAAITLRAAAGTKLAGRAIVPCIVPQGHAAHTHAADPEELPPVGLHQVDPDPRRQFQRSNLAHVCAPLPWM